MAAPIVIRNVLFPFSRCSECHFQLRLPNFSYSRRHFAKKMENLETNPFFDKYAERIRILQKTKPEEFKAKVEEMKTLKEGCEGSSKVKGQEGGKFSDVTVPKQQFDRKDPSYNREQKLEDVMKVDLIRDKSLIEISEIWKDYYRTRDKTIAAVIPAQVYESIFSRSLEFPTFVYPLPRRQGYEFILGQFSGHQCHFTSLINYQAYKENAPECLNVVHYTELQQEKGVVLMRGEYDDQILSGIEAQCLANQVQLYYNSTSDSQKFKLLKTFNTEPNLFKHSDLIDELQNVELLEKSQQ